MNILIILILAIIQGAAELLPVSSSAHVIFVAKLLGLEPSSPEFIFLLVMLHTGTMFAVLIYFWPRWRWLFTSGPPVAANLERGPRRQYWLMLIVATACTGVLGLALKVLIEKVVLGRILGQDKAHVENLFESLPLIAASLFAVGVFIIFAGLRQGKKESPLVDTSSAIWIGLVQGLCLPFRGFSRSGATISTALCRGINRSVAEEFSFALAVILTPPIIVYRLWSHHVAGEVDWVRLIVPGLVGMVFSFCAGLVALKVLSKVLDSGRWSFFGFYCLAASVVMLVGAYLGY